MVRGGDQQVVPPQVEEPETKIWVKQTQKHFQIPNIKQDKFKQMNLN